MPIPAFLQPYIPTYNVSKLEKNNSDVAKEIITQVLNLGDDKAVAWIFDNYTIDKIRGVVKNPQRGVWNEESLSYWRNILKIDKIVDYKKAILNINPV